jgi:flagellar hook assembly protein FlgD
MGLITWIAIAVIVLAVIGLGVGVFFSGLIRGAEIIGNSPAVQNVTEEAKEFLRGNMQLSSNSNVLVITTNEAIYRIGEPVIITVKNIGAEILTFPDSALGLEIQNINTGQTYNVAAAQVITELEPGTSRTITWNQEDGNGSNVPTGNYTAIVQQIMPSSSSAQSVSAQVNFEIRG